MRARPKDEPGWEICAGRFAHETWGAKLDQPDLQVYKIGGWDAASNFPVYSEEAWYRRAAPKPAESIHFL